MRTLLLFILAAVMSLMAVATRAQTPAAQSGQRAAQDKRAGSGTSQSATASKELTAAEKVIVQGSRQAILKTGITEPYFDRHFRVARVFNSSGDRRVVWKFSVNGYEATVNDAVGFYIEGSRRIDTHSVATTLPSTSDITRTITHRQAESIMRGCIGKFTNAQVEYRAHGAGNMAALLFTAQNIVEPKGGAAGREARERRERREREERERAERERREKARGQTGGGQQLDELENEGEEKDHPVILLGAVDLVTGKCMVGHAQSTP